MEKAAKEAKVNTRWADPVPRYEQALRSFVLADLGGTGAAVG
jgi:maltooligosyltrehalose synthase